MKSIGKLKIKPSNEIAKSFVSIGFETLDRQLFKPEKCYEYLASSGVKFARCQTGWARCEKQKGVYDFAWLDEIVNSLLDIGVQPWFNLGYGNPIYMENCPNPTGVGCVPMLYGDDTFNAWKNYVRALTEHFKDRVYDYEIWNEADLGCFWYPERPNGAKYGEFINLTSEIIKSIQPNAKTGGCVHSAADMPYIKSFLSSVKAEHLDFFAYHQYTRVPEHHYEQTVELLRDALNQKGLYNTELWQGEAGYPSWVFEGHWLFPEGTNSERNQAVYQLRRYFLDFKNNLSRSSFFQMADMWENAYTTAKESTARPAAHGVLNGLTYIPKMSYYTLCNIANIFAGDIKLCDNFFYVTSNINTSEMLGIRTMAALKNQKSMYFYYLPTKIGEEADNSCEVCAYEKLENPVLIDMFCGEIFDDIEIERDWHGVYHYKKLLLKDYPIILTEKDAVEF